MDDSTTKQTSDNLSHTNTEQISRSTETKRTPLNETIQIFLRLRPCRNGSYKHDHIDINPSLTSVEVKVPIKEEGYVNNSIRKHTFKFDKIFDCATTQDQIFDEVAKDVIDYLHQFGINYRSLKYDDRIMPRIDVLNRDYWDECTAINGTLLHRETTTEIIQTINEGGSVILHGKDSWVGIFWIIPHRNHLQIPSILFLLKNRMEKL